MGIKMAYKHGSSFIIIMAMIILLSILIVIIIIVINIVIQCVSDNHLLLWDVVVRCTGSSSFNS